MNPEPRQYLFGAMPVSLLQEKRLSHGAKCLYAYLDYLLNYKAVTENDNRLRSPSHATLAECVAVGRRQLQIYLTELRDCGLIRWDRRAYDSNEYEILPPHKFHCAHNTAHNTAQETAHNIAQETAHIPKSVLRALEGGREGRPPSETCSWPETFRTLNEYFPGTPSSKAEEIGEVARRLRPDILDASLAELLPKLYNEKQKTAGAWLARLPDFLTSGANLEGPPPRKGAASASSVPEHLQKLAERFNHGIS